MVSQTLIKLVEKLAPECQAIYLTAVYDPNTVVDLLHSDYSLHVIFKDGTNEYIHFTKES